MNLEEMRDKYRRLGEETGPVNATAPLADVCKMVVMDLGQIELPGTQEFVSTRTAAGILDMNPRTIARRAGRGQYPGARKTDNHGEWRIPIGELFMENSSDETPTRFLWSPNDESAQA